MSRKKRKKKEKSIYHTVHVKAGASADLSSTRNRNCETCPKPPEEKKLLHYCTNCTSNLNCTSCGTNLDYEEQVCPRCGEKTV